MLLTKFLFEVPDSNLFQSGVGPHTFEQGMSSAIPTTKAGGW